MSNTPHTTLPDPVRVDLIVPVFNEEASIDEFYARIKALGLSQALLFIDNASTDRTVAHIERFPDVRLIRHATNMGYGGSVRDGAVSSTADIVVIIDADLEYPPEALPAVLTAARTHPVVYGSRFEGPRPDGMPNFRYVGNLIATRLYNVLFGQRTGDVYTGLKALWRNAIPFEDLQRNGFEHGVEIAAMIAGAGHQIVDVPVAFAPRRGGRSKMRHVPETLKLLGLLFSYWLSYRFSTRPLGARGAESTRA